MSLASLALVKEEPDLYFVDFSGLPGAEEWRAQLERDRVEARRRYVDYLTAVIVSLDESSSPTQQATAILGALTEWPRIPTGDECHCSCHPRLPSSDLHDYGFACPCQQTVEERRRSLAGWRAERDAFWDSPEGRRISAEHDAQEAALAAWIDLHPDVVVRSHGGLAPEQWTGVVDGHSFYFRERHDEWRIELDLRPSGRFAKVWVGGAMDDDDSFEQKELDEGDVIADGITSVEGYGTTPVERIQFILAVIRSHVRRQRCDVHTAMADDLELLFGDRLAWCPACGTKLGRDS